MERDEERKRVIKEYNLTPQDNADIIVTYKHLGWSDKDIRQAIEDYRYIREHTRKTTYSESSNEVYTREDYYEDLVKISRGTSDAGSARARVQHYEHGRDPYNLPHKESNSFWDTVETLFSWGVGIFVIFIILVLFSAFSSC